MLEILPSAIRQKQQRKEARKDGERERERRRKERKDIQNGKGAVKLLETT